MAWVADLAERELGLALVEHAEHNAFAVDRRDDREADVDLAVADATVEYPSCGLWRLAMSGFGHDLEAEEILRPAQGG